MEESLEELGDCVSGLAAAGDELETRQIRLAIESFLDSLTPEKRRIFMWKYWYFESVDTISERTGYSRSKVKSMLMRLRKELRAHLEKEGIQI